MRRSTAAALAAGAAAAALAAGAWYAGAPGPAGASGANALGADAYRLMASDHEDGNVLFSPAGAHLALAGLYEGARGETAQEMSGALHIDPDAAARRGGAARLAGSAAGGPVLVAGSLWTPERFPPSDGYRDLLRDTYGINAAAAGTHGFVDDVNGWALGATGGRMGSVTWSRYAPMALFTVAHMDGGWGAGLGDRGEADFYRHDGSAVRAGFAGACGQFGYRDAGGARLLGLPHGGGGASVLLVLPRDQGAMREVEASLSGAQLDRWAAGLEEAAVDVSVPGVEIRSKYSLKWPMQRLGASDAFSDYRADFGGVSESEIDSLWPESVRTFRHDAYLGAGAAGEAAGGPCAGAEEFTADRPFLFVVYDGATGAALLMGRVADPTSPDAPGRGYALPAAPGGAGDGRG